MQPRIKLVFRAASAHCQTIVLNMVRAVKGNRQGFCRSISTKDEEKLCQLLNRQGHNELADNVRRAIPSLPPSLL